MCADDVVCSKSGVEWVNPSAVTSKQPLGWKKWSAPGILLCHYVISTLYWCNSINSVSHISVSYSKNMHCNSVIFFPSVRDGDTVKHYRIRQLDEGGFFIARRVTFRTLSELVDHYSIDADGLCVNLRKPCTQVSEIGTVTRHTRWGYGCYPAQDGSVRFILDHLWLLSNSSAFKKCI
jgi:hypothetical protein